jgi:hypothetical protein
LDKANRIAAKLRMKLTRGAFIFLVLIKASFLYGQDTISIYFKTGVSKIHKEQITILNTIPGKYDLSDLDSVYFIGLADSIGDAALNLKLSEKRAQNIAAYCEKLIPATALVKIVARGESTLEQADKNRKVSIVFYFPPEKIEAIDTVKIVPLKESCYNVDYNLLRHAHIRTVIKGRKQLTIIKARLEDIGNKEEHYYGGLSKKGELLIKPVKWKTQKGGKNIKSRALYTTSIPASDFQLFRLFKITTPPCDTCNENLIANKKLVNIDSSMQVERELMEAIDVKQSIFFTNRIKIRAPQPLVDIEDTYFIGCDQNILKWKKREILLFQTTNNTKRCGKYNEEERVL